MITGLAITNLRGVRSGELRGLAPLTILTGLNGCRKSTVRDALLIAASPEPGSAIGQAIKRHPVTRNGARWLVGGTGERSEGEIAFMLDQEDGGSGTDTARLRLRPWSPPAANAT